LSDIFICYSRSDRALADQLVQRLRAAGWSVFIDVQTRVGERWDKAIQREMHAARAFVALWSERSIESDYVLEEAEYGKRKGILVPAFIERVDFPYGFSRIQTADLVGWAGEPDHPGLAQILDALRQQLGGVEASPGSLSATPPSPPDMSVASGLAAGETFGDPLKSGGEGPLLVVTPAGRYGNVWEWCQDHWHGDYQGAPTDGSVCETGGSSSRVRRGGSWINLPRHCRAASRFVGARGYRDNDMGLGVCRGAPIELLAAAALPTGPRAR